MNHVFLSYRHESGDHAKAVRTMGEMLKTAGLPVELDQFYMDGHPGGPDEGWRKWCEDRALLEISPKQIAVKRLRQMAKKPGLVQSTVTPPR